MANWLRAAGVRVTEYEGWKQRARSSGGYEPGRPYAVFWHHTASSTDPASDAHYMCHVADARPIANVLIARDGTCWVLAAGCTNTNGSGKSIGFSRGTVPKDAANSYVLGMEIANNGTGEDYPQAQVDAAFKVSNTMNARLGNQPGDVSTHQFYAPDRKIDPAMGGNNVQGPWHPRECTNAGSWNRDDLVAECKRRGGTAPKPPPDDDEEDEEMPTYCLQANSGSSDQKNAIFWFDGKQIGWVRSPAQRDMSYVVGQYKMGNNGKPLTNLSQSEIQKLIDSGWSGGPVPPGYVAPKNVDSGTG